MILAGLIFVFVWDRGLEHHPQVKHPKSDVEWGWGGNESRFRVTYNFLYPLSLTEAHDSFPVLCRILSTKKCAKKRAIQLYKITTKQILEDMR